MRTLVQIIESAKDGQLPAHSELLYATLALDVLLSLEHIALGEIVNQAQQGKVNVILWRKVREASHHRLGHAFKADPKTLLGPQNDPAEAEYQERRAAFRQKMEMARLVGEN